MELKYHLAMKKMIWQHINQWIDGQRRFSHQFFTFEPMRWDKIFSKNNNWATVTSISKSNNIHDNEKKNETKVCLCFSSGFVQRNSFHFDRFLDLLYPLRTPLLSSDLLFSRTFSFSFRCISKHPLVFFDKFRLFFDLLGISYLSTVFTIKTN